MFFFLLFPNTSRYSISNFHNFLLIDQVVTNKFQSTFKSGKLEIIGFLIDSEKQLSHKFKTKAFMNTKLVWN